MTGKILFFDIDGTLWDIHNRIPESTVRSIRRARDNGHKIFLNSGRSRGFIFHPALFDIGLDGIVSACGTMIEYEGKTIFKYVIPAEQAERTVSMVRSYGFKAILEGAEYLYMEVEEFKDDIFGQKVIGEMGDKLKGILDHWGKWEMQKFSCATLTDRKEECFEKLREDYDLLIHSPTVAEMVPRGFHKGTGIQKVCELLSADIKNTVAFGDSVNDLDMLHAAGTSVAMGNGMVEAKEAADYVTAPLWEDGIEKALIHLGLI